MSLALYCDFKSYCISLQVNGHSLGFTFLFMQDEVFKHVEQFSF